MIYNQAKQEFYDLFPYITIPCVYSGFNGMHVYNVNQRYYNASTGEDEYRTITGEEYPLEPFVTFRTLEQMQVVNCMTQKIPPDYLYPGGNNKFGYRGKLVGVVDDPDPSRNGLYMINNDDRTHATPERAGWYALKLKFAED